MNFLNIKYFMTIAEERSISAAARKLYVSQQSLSEHLKKMETELGVPLFNRQSPLTLTVAGECFMEGGKEILKAYDRMIADIDNVTQHRRSKITLGVPTYGDPPFLADLLIQFMKKYPQYDVTVVKRLHSDIAHNMRGVDLYISYLPLDPVMEHAVILDPDPYCITVHKDLVCSVYGDRWPSISEKLLDTRDLSLLKELPFIILKDRLGQTALDLSEIFAEYHMTPEVGFFSENGDLNIEMCLKGAGGLLATTSSIYFRLFSRYPDSKADLLCYPINVSSFRPELAISYERGQHLHAAELCFISEARTLMETVPDPSDLQYTFCLDH